ncbi:MAG: type II toxin-antitoxin system RelE/ParE family toxin [Pyrinomonadaceae bacterium]
MEFVIDYFHPRILKEIESWPVDFQASYARLVEMLRSHGPYLGLPHSRTLGDGLFELRPRGKAGICRAFYCFVSGRRIIVVHAFIKKTQKTPQRELEIARRRVLEVKKWLT